MTIIDANKLTNPQRRVMEYLVHGHRARRQYGSVVYVNGGKIATVATMLALESRQLVKRSGPDEWIYNEDVTKQAELKPMSGVRGERIGNESNDRRCSFIC